MVEYRSSRRQRQAEATRRDILDTARKLFAENGFAATSVATIADEADVAVQTIYSAVGSKRTLAISLVDLIDEEVEIGHLLAGLDEIDSPKEVIALMTTITRQINERCGDIIGTLTAAGQSEPDVAAAAAEGRRRHRLGAGRLAARLAELGALRNGVTEQRAGDVMALLTSSDTYAQLTQRHGWSFDEAEDWMRDALARLLLRRR